MKNPDAREPTETLPDRLRRGDVFAPGCPSREVMRHVTSSWGLLILIALQDGTLRFGELRRRAGGVSERMLAQTLRWLEGDGLVVRRSHPVVPPHTDYTLTKNDCPTSWRMAGLSIRFMSAGQCRPVMIAIAPMSQPGPLIADEQTTESDAITQKTRRQKREEIRCPWHIKTSVKPRPRGFQIRGCC